MRSVQKQKWYRRGRSLLACPALTMSRESSSLPNIFIRVLAWALCLGKHRNEMFGIYSYGDLLCAGCCRLKSGKKQKTGCFLKELTQPLEKMLAAGYSVDVRTALRHCTLFQFAHFRAAASKCVLCRSLPTPRAPHPRWTRCRSQSYGFCPGSGNWRSSRSCSRT